MLKVREPLFLRQEMYMLVALLVVVFWTIWMHYKKVVLYCGVQSTVPFWVL